MKSIQRTLVALCRIFVALIFWCVLRVTIAMTVTGVERDTLAPRTYLGMMHRRDSDPLFLVPVLLFRHGWRGLVRDLRFALRGDGFSPHFLTRLIGRPNWLAWLLQPLSVGPLLRWLGLFPTEGLARPAEEWLREALNMAGDVQAEKILAPAFLQDFARQAHSSLEEVSSLPLTRLLAWRYYTALRKFYGPEMLLAPERRPVERDIAARIHAQLADIAAYLWQDGTILGAPEGQLSPDGHLSSLHAGFLRIMRAAPPDLRVLPIALSYDFMTSGRPHVFIAFAPALLNVPKLPPAELAARLHRSWLLHMYFTCTQLASGFLLARRTTDSAFSLDELALALYEQARGLASAGRAVDPRLLKPASARQRARRYLTYVERRGLVQHQVPGRWRVSFAEKVIEVGLREVAYNNVPLLYGYNELRDLLSVS